MSQKVENSMALSDFLNGYISVSTCCTKKVVLHKKLCCVNKKLFLHRSYVDQNYQSYRLKLCESQKNMWHQKKKLMLTKYVHCCTGKKYMLTKKVHAIYKYMLHWLKKNYVARKILWCRTKIKVGVHKCY